MREIEQAILITGGSGFIGRLTAARLLREGAQKIVLPVRAKHAIETLRAALAAELVAENADPKLAERVTYMTLPETEAIMSLRPELEALGVSEIVHAAASLDYFDEAAAQAINIDLTAAILALGQALRIRRFIYISTAFSSGVVDGLIRERLPGPPTEDLTVYTRSKRAAEHLVAESSKLADPR